MDGGWDNAAEVCDMRVEPNVISLGLGTARRAYRARALVAEPRGSRGLPLGRCPANLAALA